MLSLLTSLTFCLATRLHSVGLASRYGDPGDPPDAFYYSCESQISGNARRPVDYSVKRRWASVLRRGVATRRGSCGERLTVCTALPSGRPRCARAVRVDAGPYGRDGRGHWRGVVDMLPPVARQVGLSRGLRSPGRVPVFVLRGW